jgi:hypothetical protein
MREKTWMPTISAGMTRKNDRDTLYLCCTTSE